MFSICIWFNKWLVQLLCGISQVPKYVQLVLITASKIPLGTFFLWKPSTITSSKSELSKGVQDLRNKEVNKKAYQKSDQSWKNQVTKCLSNQHIGKTIINDIETASNSRTIINDIETASNSRTIIDDLETTASTATISTCAYQAPITFPDHNYKTQ